MDKAKDEEVLPAGARNRTHHSLRALGDAKGHLQKKALKLQGYVIVGYLIVRLIPGLKQALKSLEQVRWQWVLAAVAVEILSDPAGPGPRTLPVAPFSSQPAFVPADVCYSPVAARGWPGQ
jgi:hypothetical protein